ncbi:hypothetical protein HanHA89_Chr10g0388931 [Helianthus annuus]|nr:hypothetical protein HanHA89_Chr10g0388931 [Helianthus annuus]
MIPGKENLSASFSVLTQKQLDKFIRVYQIPVFLNPELPERNRAIYPFLTGKFAFYTQVCNFANYLVSFTKFLIKVLRFFRIHLSQMNPFGLSRINHYEISCRALNRKLDLNVFRYFNEFITTDVWYTFAYRKSVPSISSEEKTSLKNWKDHFFWLGDLCLPADLPWRFKDQSMDFDLKENFIFDQVLAQNMVDNRSPIHSLPEHMLLLGRVSQIWGRGDG